MAAEKYRFGPVVFAFETEIPMRTDRNMQDFRAPDTADPDFTVEVVPLPENSPCGISRPVDSCLCGNRITAAMNRKVIPNVTVSRLMYLIGAPKLFLQKDAFVLHASYIVREGKALLFSAPSGTGKSTQADLWHTCRGCDIINGDRVLISRVNGQFYANGAYVAGTSGICHNRTVPLGHIILLEQASSCAMRSISASQKLKRLLCECSYDLQDPEQYLKMIDLVSDLLERIPVFGYGCTQGPEAVGVLETYL